MKLWQWPADHRHSTEFTFYRTYLTLEPNAAVMRERRRQYRWLRNVGLNAMCARLAVFQAADPVYPAVVLGRHYGHEVAA